MRRFFSFVSAALAAALGYAVAGDKPQPASSPRKDTIEWPAERWKALLTAQEFHVLRDGGTERAFSGDLWNHHDDGLYICAGCGLPLFDSASKFDSGTGWPSFFQPAAADRILDVADHAFGMTRVENRCARCGGHLGHVFDDGPPPTGQRYCMNSASLDFVPRSRAADLAAQPVLEGGWTP